MKKFETPPPVSLDSTHDKERSENEFKYSVLQNPYERMHYVHLTDDLISRLDGSDPAYPKPDFVVYLDKSARPVNWMVHSLWDTLAEKDEYGNVPERPQALFVNIDARRKINTSDNSIADLRALFTVDDPQPGTETMSQASLLDGKEVLIVDEISVSGDTIKHADQLLSRAFPSAKFKTLSWMDGRPKTAGGPETNNPRWYERDSDRFRVVVENIDDDPERVEELRQQGERERRGFAWLAKLPRSASPSSRMLRQEINQLATDIQLGKLPYWPSMRRADEEQRIKEFNGIDTADFDSFRLWMKEYFWPNLEISGTITDETGPLPPEHARKEASRSGNKEFGKRTLTDGAEEFKRRFKFTHETVATNGLSRAINTKK